MVKTEASGTPEVFGTNAGPQSHACHIPRNPPTFSGESSQDPQRWIKMFERVAKYNKWDETQSLANVVFYLEGTAAQWFDNNEDIIDSWTQFKTNLCEVFGKKEELTRRAEMTLKTRAQKPGETTESYIQEILSLCSRVNPEMEEEEKVGHLMKGIAEDFYQTLIVKDPTTVDELVKFCRQLENMKQRRIKRARYERLPNEELQKIMPKMTEVEPFGSSDVNSLEAIVKEEVQQVLAPITRRNIQSQRRRTFVPRFQREDDYTPYAPRTSDQWRTVDNQPICFHCGKPGHVLRYCRERRRTFEEARSRRTLPSADNTTPQRPYDLNDDFPTLPRPGGFGRSASPYPGRGRMPRRRSQSPGADSGADYSVVSEKFRRLLRTPFFVESGPVVKVANGKLVKTLGKCSLKVHINDLTTTFEFIVIPDCSHDIILGWDFFKATRAVIDCGHQELYLEETLPINDDQINLDVYSADNYVIPPKSNCKISVVGTPLQENRDVLICPNWELSIRKEFIIPSLLTTFQQGKADLWIANGNSKPLMIPSRMALGTMSDVDVGSICSLKCDELIQAEEMWTTKLDQKIEAMIDSNLTEDQQNKMMNVLKKYSNVFDFSGKSQPARSKIKHKIDTGDHAPTKQRPYRMSGMERKIIQQEVDRMMKQDIIQFSESPWSSPVVLVKKKNGSWRFCVDYRRLNKITKKDVYPLPRVDDALDNLSGARYYSSMDLRTGYWQIEVDEHDREKTAFITPDGLYEFRILKEALTSEPVLGHFIEDAETHIHTDASGYGIGAVLIQIKGGAERPIAYASRTLTKAEKNYSTTEKELLAVVWATSKFRPYLFGRNFTVVTDHHSLCWLAGLKDPSGRLARRALRLQEFDITVVYKSGRKHKDADCLSRNPVPEEQEDFPNIISIIDIRAEQSRDPNLAKIIDKIEQTGPFKGFEVVDGVLYKRNNEPYGRQRLLVLPKQMRLEILKNLHDAPTAGHLGFAKTYDRARKRFFWGGMYKTIRQYIAHCRECQRRKSVPQRPPGQLMPIPPADFPFQKIGMDLLGRFPVTNQGNKWIIVCTEYMTRFATTKAIPDAGAMEIAKFIVKKLFSDTELLSRSSPTVTNGLTERLNKRLTDMLSMYVDVEQKNWDEVLPFVTFAYNTAKQETTGFSPFFLVHGREAETTLDSLLPYHDNDDVGDYVQHLITTAEEARHLAQLHLYRGQEKDRKYYDRKHRPVDYNVGDLVWLFIPVRKVGLSEKLIKKYFGPYRITRKLSPVNYEIEAISDSPKRRKTRNTVHVLRMKPYLDPLLQEEISGSTPNKEPVLKQRLSDPEPISGPVTRSKARRMQIASVALKSYTQQAIDVLGDRPAKIKHGNTVVHTLLHVVRADSPILGLELFNKLGLSIKDGKVNQITESSKILETLPFAKDIEYKIFVDTSVPPVQQKLRRLPPVLLDEVHKEIQRLVKMDIIEPIVTSKWISPIVVSKNKDGSIRLCVDLREPNKAVILDAYPIPLIEDILSSLHGCKVFTNLDLSQAYHQIRLHPNSRYLTAFITHMGIYQFKRLPYGLSSAPGAFQRYLSELLMDIKGKYIPNKSTIMEPLQKLLKKSVPFKWRGEHANALQTVKESLKKGQVLALFCPKLPTVITTDASHSGIGCVVSQLSEKGEERIVACASRTLSDAERKYSIVEKEALACVWACEKFIRLVWGQKFTLRTDQSSLTTLLTTKGYDREGLRIARWSARLMNFDYIIEYRKGRDNVLPDYLSRSSLSSHEDYGGEVELIASINQDILAISEEEFLRECSLCPEIIALKEQLMKPWSNNKSSQLNKYFRLRKDLSVQEDLILNEKGKILVPVSFRNKLLSFAHKAHQGMVRTKQRLRESYWWPGMDKDVEDLVTNCWVCKNHDKKLKSIRVPITPVERPANPWTNLGLDIVGPFIDTEIGFRFAITLIDYTSKWPEVFCTDKTTSKVIINFLEDVFSREGFPREIVTDNGTTFISEEFEDFLGSNGIKHIRTANYHPACNGEVENFNKTLKSTVLTAHLQHTENVFDPKNPEKWITYLERMNFFFLANDIVKHERRKAIFLTLLGAETYVIARSLASPKELSLVEYDNLIKLLADHFCPKPNLIVQRLFFNKRNQGEESVSAYVAELRKLSENCEFVDLEDRLRDGLVCELRKESIVKRLLSESNLTFDKALNIAICDESASADAPVFCKKKLRKFLKNKSTVVEPLHRLLDSNSPWKWRREHQRSFDKSKDLISSESVLALFDDNLPILINCDASEYGFGAILSQKHHRVEKPVMFASRTLNKAVWCIKFSQYLIGRKFKILTDHKPLVGRFNPKKLIPQVLSPRMLRWCLTLAAYTYTIEYKPGKVNCNDDALSRLPLNECPSVVPNPSEVFFIESEHPAINSTEVAKLTSKDPILSKIKFWAMNGWPERKVDDKFKDFVSKSNEISVHKDCLLWRSKVIIPERLRKYILNLLHDTHIGILGTKALVRGLCWWPEMDKDIERMISSCAVCLSCSNDPPKTDVYPWIWPSRPWSRLPIDHAGPFQGKLFQVVVDTYSEWIEAKIVSTTSTETTINSLKEIFAIHRLPDVIVSENGTSFTSELYKTFLKRNDVRHILCAPYHAASNGQVERAIQTLKNLLRKNSSGNWTTRLSRSLLSMRIAINSTTQKSPAQLLMNRNLKSLINKFHPESVSEGRIRQEDRFIRNWKPHRVVNEGQAVMARGYHGPRWLPGLVQEKTGPFSIKVETDDGEILNRLLDQVSLWGEVKQLRLHRQLHKSQLKLKTPKL
ncbi:hypothetical protein LAZ67_10001233, partial [Cordylochernes scorpioides]